MNLLLVRKRSLPEWSAILLFLLPFVYSFLTEFLGLPNAIKFMSDFLIIVPIVLIVVKSFSNGRLVISKLASVPCLIILIFLAYTIIGYVLNYQSVLYYIWGMRNNFRFYLAFFIFFVFLESEDAEKGLKLLDILFGVHVVVTLIQYFYFGHVQDYLGGIFGIQKGCNGYTIAFISIIVMKSLLSYMNNKEKTVWCMLKCAAALLVSVLAELKVFFLIFIIIMILSAVITKFSAKKVLLIFGAFVVISFSYVALITLFENFEGFLSIEYLINEFTRENYASSEDLGRFTSIPTICRNFLTTAYERLIGMGLGNCDTSTISIFNTAFYDRYVDIHYSIFSVSFIFMETGFIGLALFISFFVACFVQSLRFYRQKRGNLMFNQMGIIMSVLCLLLMFYNSSLRTEAGYMIYFVLVLPFIGVRNQSANSLR